MLSIIFTLFFAGLLTILLPCILPLIPIVLGVSVVDKNRWKPLVIILGMLVSFVGSTFLLQVVLSQFVELADIVRITTFYILLLFGLGFLVSHRALQYAGAILGSVFFWDKGWIAMGMAAVFGVLAMEMGGRVATGIQQFGTDVQGVARTRLGANSLVTAFIIGLTLGFVWVPCAGPALGFALSVVRDEPGLNALLYLSAYGVGAGLPLLLIGYGGQSVVHSARVVSTYSGRIKQVCGGILVLSALAFQYNLFQDLQTWLVSNTHYGTFGTRIEETVFGTTGEENLPPASSATSSSAMTSQLPFLGSAPKAFVGLGPWHNSSPLTLEELRGKVVLIDFWTYSCINCIRTLPYIQALAEKYADQPFVLLGVHTPEFIFEKSEKNVAAAIKKHGLTYPIAQDNDFGTWRAFDNHYWPAKYLIDAKGNIRYTHFGEGAYDETDDAIASLLLEAGLSLSGALSLPPEVKKANKNLTPETYLHSRSWSSFNNAQGDPDAAVHTYSELPSLALHTFALAGTWQLVDDERQVLLSETGSIRIRALAGEVNLVLGSDVADTPVTADIELDGKAYKTITILNHDLYNLFSGEYGEHDVVLRLHGKGVSAYAFTFGG